jgi:hypothetical protein
MYAGTANSPGLFETYRARPAVEGRGRGVSRRRLRRATEPRLILAIAVKTLSNYSNHLFHTALDPAFVSREWKHSA